MNDTIYFETKINHIESLMNASSDRVDSLSNDLNHYAIGSNYFHDILSHQWYLLSIQTAIFILIITLMLTIVGLISWNYFFKKITGRIVDLENQLQTTQETQDKLGEISAELKQTTNKALRSLYESADKKYWKVIWHIRYIEWFYDNSKIESLIIRIGKLNAEYTVLKNDPTHYTRFKAFENKGGLKRILKKLILDDRKELSKYQSLLLEIYKDLE